MHIIFAKSSELEEKYTVLELDTFKIDSGESRHTAYCVIENIPLEEMPILKVLKDLHGSLMLEYQNKNWHKCESIIGQLKGKWGGEMDSFYIELASRVAKLKTQTLDINWTAVIEK